MSAILPQSPAQGEDEGSTSVPSPRVWQRRNPTNYPQQVEVLGGVAAPLLAGFSLATVAELVIGSTHPWLAQWAILALTVAAIGFIYSLQLSAFTLGFAATPQERLDFNPEARSDQKVLHRVRARQWQEMDLRVKYGRRAGIFYNLGIVAFLTGFGLLATPRVWHPFPTARFLVDLLVAIAVLLELIWWLSRAKRPKWLLPPRNQSLQVDNLPDDGKSFLFD